MATREDLRTAVLIPCRNEELTIAGVVRAFGDALPGAEIYVFDNCSTDASVEEALRAGAEVRHERRPGKGNVTRRMFADVEADVYVLVDGDGTYDPAVAPEMVEAVVSGANDLVSSSRRPQDGHSYPPGHRLGNRMLSGLLRLLFGSTLEDLLSGYKALSRRYVRSFPVQSRGFEIETEMAVHALSLRMPIAEVPVSYGRRPDGSKSKLNTWRDGSRILRTMANLVRQERPLAFFSVVALFLVAISLAIGYPVLTTFARTGLVPKLPSAVLASGIMVLAFLSLVSGLILDTVTRGRLEQRLLWYTSIPGPAGAGALLGASAPVGRSARLRQAAPEVVPPGPRPLGAEPGSYGIEPGSSSGARKTS